MLIYLYTFMFIFYFFRCFSVVFPLNKYYLWRLHDIHDDNVYTSLGFSFVLISKHTSKIFTIQIGRGESKRYTIGFYVLIMSRKF